MNEMDIFLFTEVFVYIIIFLAGFFLQEISREEVFFGIRVTSEIKQRPDIKRLGKRYKINYSISITSLFILNIILFCYFSNPSVVICGVFIYIPAIFINYFYIYKKVSMVKNSENWQMASKNIVVVDTNFRFGISKRLQPSSLWFLLPIALIILNFIITVERYNILPQYIVTHWDINGIPNGWSKKTYLSLLFLPILEAFMLAIMFAIYRIIGRVKQQLNPNDIEVSKEKSRRFRYIWSAFYIFVAVILVSIFTLLQLGSVGLMQDMQTITIITIILSVLIAIGAIIIALITGQSGSRLKLKSESEEKQSIMNRNDDSYWKMGMFYYNKDDPSLFIEKRMGVGWDLNYARFGAKIFIAVISLIIIGSIALTILVSINMSK